MSIINAFFGFWVDLMVSPFRAHPLWGLVVSSLAVALLMLVVFKFTASKSGIKRCKDRIKANLLAVWLYRDDPLVSLKAQGGILAANLRYMGYAVLPLLIMLPFLILTLVHLDAWFGKRPLRPGETTLLTVLLKTGGPLPSPMLELPAGLSAETEAFRLSTGAEVDWSLKAKDSGSYEAVIELNGSRITKRISVGDRLDKLSSLKTGSALDSLLNPVEPAVPADSPFQSIRVTYPATEVKILGRKMHWMIPFFVLSILFAFALKGPLKVEI